MATASLKDRNPFSEKANYDRKTQIKILTAKLREQLGKKPDCIEQSRISACAILIISLHDMQEQFTEGGILSPKYGRTLYSLQAILNKLGLKPKARRGKKGQNKSFDLAHALSED